MDITYENLKEYAKEHRMKTPEVFMPCRKDDTSSTNDPFYSATPANLIKAEWFVKIWEQYGKPNGIYSIRRLHYHILSKNVELPEGLKKPTYKNGRIYANIKPHKKLLEAGSVVARWQKMIDIDEVEDKKNDPAIENVDYSERYDSRWSVVPDPPHFYIDDLVRVYGRFSAVQRQRYHLELVIEKSTQDDILMPLLKRYRCNLQICSGVPSITRGREIFQRCLQSEKPSRIFYISDFDAAGECMPASMSRWIEKWTQDNPCDIRLKQIALTREQCEEYNLPKTPASVDGKPSKRAQRFEDRYGEGRVELDALDPDILAKLLRDSLLPYFDTGVEEAVRDANNDFYRTVKKQADELLEGKSWDLYKRTTQLEIDYREMLKDIDWNVAIPEEPDLSPAAPAFEDDDDWLFDSQRDYFTQLAYYRKHIRGDDTE